MKPIDFGDPSPSPGGDGKNDRRSTSLVQLLGGRRLSAEIIIAIVLLLIAGGLAVALFVVVGR